MSQADASPNSRKKGSLVFLSSFLILCVSQFLWSRNYFVGIYNDDACYLLKAFSFSGISVVPGTPPSELGAFFSAGWPLVLTPFSWLLGFQYSLYRCLSLALVYLGLCCWLQVFRAHFSTGSVHLLGASILLSGSALEYSSTLMAEPLFFFLVGFSLWMWPRREKTWVQIMLPASLALSALTRVEGITLLLCFFVYLAWKRKGIELLKIVASAVALFLAARTLFAHKVVQVSQSGGLFAGDLDWVHYLQNWSILQLRTLARAIFSQANDFTMATAFVLLALGLLGAYKLLQLGIGPHPLLLVLIPLALFFWPYFASRYWLVALPLILAGAFYTLPKNLRKPTLSLLILGQIWFASTAPPVEAAKLQELYRSLATTSESSKLVAAYGCRATLQCRRTTINLPKFQTLIELTAYMASHEAEFLIWESDHSLIRDYTNSPQENFPQDILPWLIRSTLFEIHFRNSAGLVVRLRSDPKTYLAAFELYRESLQSTSFEGRREKLQNCLALIPDFPQARLSLLLTELEANPQDKHRVATKFKEYLEQYPHDFEAAVIFSQKLPINTFRAALEQSQKEASLTGRVDVAELLSRILQSEP